MKRIICLILAAVWTISLCGCGGATNQGATNQSTTNQNEQKNSGTIVNQEKLVGTWVSYSKADNHYYFDNNGNVANAWLYSFMADLGRCHSMHIKTGTYSMDDEKITINYTRDKNYYSLLGEEIKDSEITETEVIPYYMSEYTHSLVFNPDDTGKSIYEYDANGDWFGETFNSVEQFTTSFENYWPKFCAPRQSDN